MRERDLKSDLWWGMRNGLIVMAIALTPALIGWMLDPDRRLSFTSLTGGQVLMLYLGFGALGGAFAGLARPWLKRRLGATAIGSVLGALGFLGLSFLPSSEPADPGLRSTLVAIGVLVGGLLGWFNGGRLRR